MSEPSNLIIVQRAFKAFADGDFAALEKLLTDDVEWTYHPTHSGIPWAQHSWHGPDRVLQSLKMITDLVEFLEFQPDEFIVGNDSVAVLGHERCRVKASGRIVEAKWVQILTLRNEKISRYREYSDTAAWDNGYSGGTALSDRQ
jgi:uncharacterized protein